MRITSLPGKPPPPVPVTGNQCAQATLYTICRRETRSSRRSPALNRDPFGERGRRPPFMVRWLPRGKSAPGRHFVVAQPEAVCVTAHPTSSAHGRLSQPFEVALTGARRARSVTAGDIRRGVLDGQGGHRGDTVPLPCSSKRPSRSVSVCRGNCMIGNCCLTTAA